MPKCLILNFDWRGIKYISDFFQKRHYLEPELVRLRVEIGSSGHCKTVRKFWPQRPERYSLRQVDRQLLSGSGLANGLGFYGGEETECTKTNMCSVSAAHLY